MHEVLSELWGLRTYVGERIDSLDDRIDAIDARFEGMDTHITQPEEDMSYLHQCFDLPPPSS